MITLVPSRLIGAFDPLKSDPVQIRVLFASPLPLISSHEPEPNDAEAPKSEAEVTEVISGRVGGGVLIIGTV